MVRTLSLLHIRSARAIDPIRPALELSALAMTGLLHLLWPAHFARTWLVVPLVVGWLGYFALRWKVDPRVVHEVGFRSEGLRPTAAACMVLLGVAGPAMVAWGVWHGATLPWSFPLTLVVYPVWGLVQQALVQGLITANVRRLAPAWVAVGVSSTLFGLVHWNEPVLVVATFLLGLVFAPLYLRHRNLWALGLAHGWLGSLVYPFVLLRDPLAAYLA